MNASGSGAADVQGSSRRLLLFDIDGTLIHKGKMGSTALRRAFHRLHRLEDALANVRLDGMTDRSICREVYGRHRLDWSETAWRLVIDAYIEFLEQEARERPSGQLCPGVAPLLEDLARRDDCVLGLLTGNVRRGAEIKLRAFGIWNYFRLGAYGCDRERRGELVEVALGRAREAHGLDFSPAQAVIVGDTPADVEAARHGGCACVAVATGRYSVDELRACGPDAVLPDLGDLPVVLQALGLEAQWCGHSESRGLSQATHGPPSGRLPDGAPHRPGAERG
jgi:phosphoglycolate phosphatase-like HAD superfamily hydrolase